MHVQIYASGNYLVCAVYPNFNTSVCNVKKNHFGLSKETKENHTYIYILQELLGIAIHAS